ncbi:MAG TPA: hypothetical protein VFL87_00410 [Thermoleophilaceae bacterium]|nr:hypothetical protein [Thermoleophilaceae bacterium]
MNLRRLRPVDWATGLFGAALIGLLWAPWYSGAAGITGAYFNRSVGAPAAVGTAGTAVSFNAWQAMSVDDVIFLIAGLTALAVVAFTVFYSTAAVSIAAAVFTTWLGLIAAVVAVIRLIAPPDLGPGPTDRQAGVWLGAAAAIGLAISAALNMREERRSAPGSYQLHVTELPAPRPEGM